MGMLGNPRHERFAQLIAQGKSGAVAYREAGFNATTSAAVNANRLMKSAKVRTRIDEMMADRQQRDEKANERAIEKSAISKAWVLENLRLNVERALQQRSVLDKDGKETGEYKYDGAVANR